MKKLFKCIYLAIVRTIEKDGIEHAGYMSFMIILSLFPFLVFFLALTSFFGASQLGMSLIDVIMNNSPENIIDSIKVRILELQKAPPSSLMSLAVFGTVWTSSSFVEGLRTILNRIFEVKSPPPYITRRLTSIFQFIILTSLLAIIMFIFVLLPILFENLSLKQITHLNISGLVLKYFIIFFTLFLTVLCFYTLIPNIKLNIKNMIPGAIFTAITWQVSGYLLSTYIVYYHQLSFVYGSLGSIIVTLLFFYIINFLFILGGALNYQLLMYRKNNGNA